MKEIKEIMKTQSSCFDDLGVKLSEPLQKTITAEDYEMLKAINVLYGDCWIVKDQDGEVWLHGNKPEKESTEWVSDERPFSSYDFSNVISWNDAEPLHITSEWLTAVEPCKQKT